MQTCWLPEFPYLLDSYGWHFYDHICKFRSLSHMVKNNDIFPAWSFFSGFNACFVYPYVYLSLTLSLNSNSEFVVQPHLPYCIFRCMIILSVSNSSWNHLMSSNLFWLPFVFGAQLYPRETLYHLFGYSLYVTPLSPVFWIPCFSVFWFTPFWGEHIFFFS